MSSPQSPVDSESRLPESAHLLTTEHSAADRWLVRVLIALVALVIVIALLTTVGRDALMAMSRHPALRRVVAKPVAPLPEPRFEASANVSREAASALTGLPATSATGGGPDVVRPSRREQPLANQQPGHANQLAPDAPAEVRPNAQEVARVEMPIALLKPNDPVDNLLEEAARLVALSWQDFDYPARWLAAETSKPRMLYNSHRNRLLNAIAHSRPNARSLAEARADYATAREQFGDDPRLDYAFGLALWKHGQSEEALAVMQTAARLEETPFLPAALAVAWGRFLNGDERRGLDQMIHIAQLIGRAAGSSPSETQKHQAALQLGRAVGFLMGPGRTPELAEAVGLTALNIRERLPAELRLAFDDGQQQIGLRQSELLQLTARSEGTVFAEHREMQIELQSQVNTLRDELKQTHNEIKRTHQSYLDRVKKVLDEALNIRAQMAKAQEWVPKLKGAIQELSQPKPHVQVAPGSGALQPSGSNGRATSGRSSFSGPSSARSGAQTNSRYGPKVILMPETVTERAARVERLNKMRDQLKEIELKLAEVREKHRELIAQRREAEAQEAAETKIARAAQAARRIQQRELEQRLKELNAALRQTLELRRSLETIAAYVPWTVEVEGAALRQSLTAR